MADDKNKNEDPEEERDDQFDDDEDFGLPDLEYDELDDDDDEDLSDEEQEDALEEEEIVPKDDEIDLSGDNLDDVELTDADLEDSDEPEDWEKELEKELEDELKSDDETGGFYEEESYEEFESQGESQVASSVFDDDNNDTGFGATSEYTEETFDTPTYTTSSGVSDEDQEASRGKFVRTVVIGTLLFAVVAVVLYLYSGGSDDAPEEKKVAKVEQKAPAKKPEPEVKEVPKEETPAKVEEKKPVAKPKAQKPKPTPNTTPAGEITKFDQPTGKTYVIVGSFFDDDLATDYASKLASEGKSPMVIPPFNDSRFYRVAIAGFDTFKDAQQSLDGYKSEYGSDVWTLRY